MSGLNGIKVCHVKKPKKFDAKFLAVMEISI
jgi:hypothetical protein